MNEKNVFAIRLTNLLEENNVSQTSISNTIGITRQAISQYCNGGTTPNVEILIKIAKYFDVSSDYLIGLSDTPATDIDDKAITEKTGLSYDAVNNLKSIKKNTGSELDGLVDDSKKILKTINFVLSDSKDGLQFLLEIARYLFVDYEVEDENNEIALIDKKTKRKTIIKVSTFKQSLLSGISYQLQEWKKEINS